MCKIVRINTDGKKDYREGLYERAAVVFDENTKVAGIDRACIHAREDKKAKAEALEWMETHLTPAEADELATILSTSEMGLNLSVETNLTVDDETLAE